MDGGGALIRRPVISPYIGGDYRLKVSFEANKDEKIYGMGQYQQDILDLKAAILNWPTETPRHPSPSMYPAKATASSAQSRHRQCLFGKM